MYNSGNSSKNVTGAVIVDGAVETADLADGSITPGKLNAAVKLGKVLQVVNAETSTQVGTSSATPTDSGLTLSITPTLATSTILVQVQVNGVYKNAANDGIDLTLCNAANSVLRTFGVDVANTESSSHNNIGTVGISFMHSPAATTAQTYKVRLNAAVGGIATGSVQVSGSTSTITAMEIGA
jgi:hypothetical protein